MTSSKVILDIGAYTIKAGYAKDDEPKVIPNAVCKAKSERRRLFIADQIDECKDLSSLFYILPYQKGFLMNFDIEKQIWDYLFKTKLESNAFNETSIILTQPHFNFRSIDENIFEIFFEDYGFNSLLLTNPSYLSMFKYGQEIKTNMACLVVDSGYSFTHIIPYVDGKLIKSMRSFCAALFFAY